MFCQNYQKIAKALVLNSDSQSVEQLSNRVVHVSVQLFSNKILAEKVVRDQNLLHIMVKVLHDMARPSLQNFRRGGMSLRNPFTCRWGCNVLCNYGVNIYTVQYAPLPPPPTPSMKLNWNFQGSFQKKIPSIGEVHPI